MKRINWREISAPAIKSASWLADMAIPPRCPACGIEDVSSDHFCMDCWNELDFLSGHLCDCCGLQLDEDEILLSDLRSHIICPSCQSSPPIMRKISAAVRYNDVSSALVLKLKYARKTGLAKRLANMMMRLMPYEDSKNGYLIVPVPLHRYRIWTRGFNQSAMIARELSALSGLPLSVDALKRTKRTRPLEGLGIYARSKELEGAITANRALLSKMKNRDILLIDDVLTSGATSNACAHAVLCAGAASVRLICWARVIA